MEYVFFLFIEDTFHGFWSPLTMKVEPHLTRESIYDRKLCVADIPRKYRVFAVSISAEFRCIEIDAGKASNMYYITSSKLTIEAMLRGQGPVKKVYAREAKFITPESIRYLVEPSEALKLGDEEK